MLGGPVLVAEGRGDDGCGCLQDELAESGGARRDGGQSERLEPLAERAGRQWLSGAAAGNSQRLSGLLAVFMVALASRSSRSSPASGSGTGVGGSPRRR